MRVCVGVVSCVYRVALMVVMAIICVCYDECVYGRL